MIDLATAHQIQGLEQQVRRLEKKLERALSRNAQLRDEVRQLRKPEVPPLPFNKQRAIILLQRGGMTAQQIADEVGLSLPQVRRLKRKLNENDRF